MHLFAVISHVPLTSVFLTTGIQIQSWAEIQVWQKFLLYSAMYFHQEAKRQMFTGNTKSHQETQTVRVIQGLNKRWSCFQSWDDGTVTEKVVITVAFERPVDLQWCQGWGSGCVCTGEMQLKWARRSEGLSVRVCLPKSPQEVQWRPGGLEMREGGGWEWQAHPAVKGDCQRAPESTVEMWGESRAE